MIFSDYPDHVVVFYIIGLHITVTVATFTALFAIDMTVRRILRRRKARLQD